jgi:spore maturation protein CgeB
MNPKYLEKNTWQWQATELRSISCPLCNSEDSKIIYSRHDALEIATCLSCSFRFVQPQPSQIELNRFYHEGYFSGNRDFHQGSNYFDARKKSIDSEQVTGWQFLKENADLAGKRVLDLGCADGAVLVLAQQYGASRVCGIEVSTEAARYGRERYGVEILEVSADALPFAPQTFDIITAFDLIEHVREPLQLFQSVYQILESGGLFIGGCPDMGCFDDWGGKWKGIFQNMEHLSYFDRQTLTTIAEKIGFKTRSIEYSGFPLQSKSYTHPINIPIDRQLTLLQKAIQPDVGLNNIWQKFKVKLKNSPHKHELLFVFEKK